MKKLLISGFSDEISPDFDEQLAAVKEFGLSHIELRGVDGTNVSDLSPQKLREVKAKLSDAGISVSSIGSPIGKIAIDDDFAAHMDKLKRTLEIQKELNAPYIRVFSFYLPQGAAPEAYRDRVFERINAMIDEAKRWESVLLHENEKQIYGDNADRCLELMNEFYGEHFKAVFDFANFVEVGQDTLSAYSALRPFIEYIHIKDATAEKKIVPAGMGSGKIFDILSNLISGGWHGFMSMEPHLVDFTGLAELEQNAAHRGSVLSGKEAWQLALGSFKKLLADINGAEEALR